MLKKSSRSPVKTLKAFIEYLENECVGKDLLFRGQPGTEPLLPKIGRPTTQISADLEIEEQKIYSEFTRRIGPFLEQSMAPRNSWDRLALGQHHGLLTRLLDWTRNPLTALWFTVNKPLEKVGQNGTVWVFSVKGVDYADTSKSPFKITSTKVFRPNHVAKRLVAQDGWFTVHAYLDKKGFIPLERNSTYTSRLTKIEIDGQAFARIRRALDRCGINSSSLYPEISGLCEWINWDHTRLSDELVAEESLW